MLLAKLCRMETSKAVHNNLIFDDEDLEKPHFPNRGLSSPAVVFELSRDGDEIPYTINRYLRDYQREGAQFLYRHYVQENGCILGDDMGLGKTIQVISFLAAVLHKKGTRADIESNMPEFLLRTMKKEKPSVPKKIFLIVSPLSVLYNWKDELDTWGYFKVIVLHGSKKDYELNRIKQGKFEIALTTYETLRLYLDELDSVQWSAVIMDEVHRIKNPKAQVTQTMKSLTCKIRMGLTGTILQNNMKELWCVMDWAVPGLLGSEACFKRKFSDPVEHGQRHTATKRELATGRKAMRVLAQKMSGYFLRRTKSLINDQLPKKEDRIIYCSLTEFQKAVYKAVLKTEDVHLVLQARELCGCNSGQKRKNCCYKTNAHGETMKALYFSYITILRKIANHAALLQIDNTTRQQEAHITRVCGQVFSQFPDFVQLSKDAAFEIISDPKYSGKMKVLQKLLNHFRKKRDKVLLFSFSTKLLDVLEQYCMASGLDYRRLDGNTKAEDRVKIVKEFNSGEEVNICLVSTMAGGLGLNFVGANIVILFDPTWNPANDLQAIDRAYRIGQCRDVKVFRLISLGTVEEMMYLRQVYKQQLHCVVVGSENARRYFEAVQGSKEHQGELFGIHNLFRFQDHGSCLTKFILEREGHVEAGIMTATTWLKEEPQRQETEAEEYSGEDQDTIGSKKLLEKRAFDFSSDFSDEEPARNSKVKAEQIRSCNGKNTKILPGQLSLLQCGFLKFLEANTKMADDSSGVDGQNGGCPKAQDRCSILGCQQVSLVKSAKQELPSEAAKWDKERRKATGISKKDLFNLNEVDIVVETEDSSTESADIVFPSQVPAVQESLENFKNGTKSPACLETEKCPGLTPKQKYLTPEKSCRTILPSSKITRLKKFYEFTSLKDAGDISDESDDLEMTKLAKQELNSLVGQKQYYYKELENSHRTHRRRNNSTIEDQAYSQNIEEFSSSEDDSQVKNIDVNKYKEKLKSNKTRKYVKHPSVTLRRRNNSSGCQTSFSKQAVGSQGQKHGSLDRLLDDVAEVTYVHSNQNVIGSSKAENWMSRWAVRDVFELKQFSQLPANITVCSAKKVRQHPEQALPPRKSAKKSDSLNESSKSSVFYITHPVCQKQKTTHQVGSVTFMIGKTPKSLRRKQFEEMASYFHNASVEEFAMYITKTSSVERLGKLKEFYGTKYPELKDLLKIDPASGGNEEATHRTQSRKRKSSYVHGKLKSVPSRDLCSQTRHEAESKPFQYDPCIQAAVCDDVEDKQLPTVITQDSISGRNSQAFKDFMAFDSLSSKSEVIEGLSANAAKGQPNLKGTESPRKPFLSLSESRPTQMLKQNSVADILGDTSILNDLFSSSGGSRAKLPKSRSSLSGPAEKAKTRPKDFWDMLNEQNEETLQKLTDVAVIESLCEKSPHKTLAKGKEQTKSLWKKNDNFLWKKYAVDTDDEF